MIDCCDANLVAELLDKSSSSKNAEPLTPVLRTGEVRFNTPLVAAIVLPLMLTLSTCNAVRVPTEVIAVCAAPVTVAAVPDALPVTLPVTLPSKLATNVPVA